MNLLRRPRCSDGERGAAPGEEQKEDLVGRPIAPPHPAITSHKAGPGQACQEANTKRNRPRQWPLSSRPRGRVKWWRMEPDVIARGAWVFGLGDMGPIKGWDQVRRGFETRQTHRLQSYCTRGEVGSDGRIAEVEILSPQEQRSRELGSLKRQQPLDCFLQSHMNQE